MTNLAQRRVTAGGRTAATPVDPLFALDRVEDVLRASEWMTLHDRGKITASLLELRGAVQSAQIVDAQGLT
jgi:hypothetical protein